MSTKLGMVKLYLNIGEFNKILKLKDYRDMEIVDIKKNDVGNDIEFKIVAPMDTLKDNADNILSLYTSHYDVKRKAINLEAPKDNWHIGLDRNDLIKSDTELGKLIKDKCTKILNEFQDIKEINFKIFIDKDYE